MAFKKKSSGVGVFFLILFILALLVVGGYFLRKENIKKAEKVIADCESKDGESFCSNDLGLKFCVCNEKQEKTATESSGDGISNVLKIEEDLV